MSFRSGTVVGFKSFPKNYWYEENDVKNNTLRKVDKKDERFMHLKNNDAKYIMITNTLTGESFRRKIRDITFWKGWVVITWKPLNFWQKFIREVFL